MMAILVTIMGLAAIFGFSLTVYFFFYRVEMAQPLRWLGAIVGGPVVAALMVGATMVILWPPVNFVMAAAVLIFAGILTALALGGRKGKAGTALGDGREAAGQSGRDGYEDVDVYSLDFNTGTRS